MIDVEKAQALLDDITFQVLKLEKVSDEIKSIEDLKDIKASLENLKDVKIDTSRFEKEMELEFQKIKNKIENLNDNFDFSELDEISERLTQIQKSTKPFKTTSLLLVAIGFLCIGYALNIVRPIIPQSIEMQKFEIFKQKGLEIKENKEYRYIFVPTTVEVRKFKNGTSAILIKK